MKVIYYILSALLLNTIVSCGKLVDIDKPRTELPQSSVFLNDNTAIAAMVGVYSGMNTGNYQFANVLTTFMAAMSADEFAYAAVLADFSEFRENALLPGNTRVNNIWEQAYQLNYSANAIIEGLTASTTLSPAVKTQLLGDARFVRAFCHFYLVNMFGDVPLILDADVRKNTNLPRTAKEQVYTAIIADLKEAKELLSNDYPGNKERIRPNKAVATALLSRVYLYIENYAMAEQEAGEVINNSNYKLLKDEPAKNGMKDVFLMNSPEALWQLQSVNTGGGRNTWEGNLFVPTAAPLYRLTKEAAGLENAFESGDKRFKNWVGSYTTTTTPGLTHRYPFKYKVRTGTPVTEYSMVIRFAELYLIRAEARIMQNKLEPGIQDLNVLRDRAGLAGLATPASQEEGMRKVEQERRVELFAEWGHRWFDLKRWKSISGDAGKTRADDVLGPIKPAWKSTAILFPIPTNALRTNLNLVQNKGYN
ncbi:RagB/SusD family nutrient uptake outer membrane protein [Pedobacter caeni]|uniref:SusD family protein n=1 Tax=Pedobacter caeni TaxID=288992 RepID=A0A1M5PM72_9SPHI|nr:RagB/SusD family nutrient uptake outer membrane protein [Pedobacter caeni]SHH02821.1 SusD family protein [Pedobacter caeni]